MNVNKILIGGGYKENRDIILDICRGFAIVLITWGHVTNALFSGELRYYFPIKLISATFVMPLFIGICGYLSYNSIIKYSTIEYVKKRIERIMIPCVLWNFISWLILALIKITVGDGQVPRFNITGIWFLWAVLVCEAIFLIQYKTIKTKKGFLFSTILISALLLLIPTDTWYIAWVYPFFGIGAFTKAYTFNHRMNWNWNLWIWGMFIYGLLLGIYKDEYLVYISGSSIWNERSICSQLFIDIFRFIMGLLGSITVVGFVKLIIEKVSNSVTSILFSYLGQISMEIYVMQVVIIELLLTMFVRNIEPLKIFLLEHKELTVYPIGLAITCLSLICFIVIKKVIHKLPRLDRILFG